MRQTVYKCDQCEKEIGNKKHVSLACGQYSGVAVPPKEVIGIASVNMGSWQVKSSLQGKFMHFCNGQCIARFFSDLIKSTK